ncbi:Gamma-tubulin complex component 2 [Hypsibius exemplaris]|uniref:Gamma-tubulin complex component n=1 Tax=Hypsibius exemplaris TaxID=2072580 RepID=A0A1W0WAG7_HYPEX|nr:Gamma-tubulin complex component 2 [Hypsibius exemplaris]
MSSASHSAMPPPAGGEFQRPFRVKSHLLSADFLETSSSARKNFAPIGALPVHVQEAIMLKELLAVLQGQSKDYIYVLPLDNPMGTCTFGLDDSLDAAVKHYVLELLPIASLYSKIARFIDGGDENSCGMVMHAFLFGLRQFLREYKRFLTDREDASRTGQLTIQQLYHHILPLFDSFQSLDAVIDVSVADSVRGGALLSLLQDRIVRFARTKEVEQLLLELTKAAAKPFLHMLSQWMHEGTFEDPYGEFMIATPKQRRPNETARRMHDASYWERRYKLVPEMVPSFLLPFTDKILRSGKYLNIIHQCGHSIRDQEAPVLQFNLNSRYYEAEVERAFLHASGRLLHLMLDSENLMPKLRTFKHFFLLDRDDFLPDFFVYAADDLRLPVSAVDKGKLLELFDDAVKTSVLNGNPYKGMMTPTVRGSDLLLLIHNTSEPGSSSSNSDRRKESVVLNCFTMDCQIKFPLCLIINDQAKQYQILFQHLFRLKVVEWNLTQLWTSCVNSTNAAYTILCSSFIHQMLEFIKSLQHYFSGEVIEPYWAQMMVKIRAAKTFDEVFEEHNEFITSCSKDCMLTSPDILRLMYKLLDNCGSNCSTLQDPRFTSHAATMSATLDVMQENFAERIASLMRLFADSHQNREFDYKLLDAVQRIDYNDYYRNQQLERSRSREESGSGSARDFRICSSSSHS